MLSFKPAFLLSSFTFIKRLFSSSSLSASKSGLSFIKNEIVFATSWSITSDADDTTLMTESEEELKSLLMKVKEESEKAGLKLNIQKMKIMASVPSTSWQIDGETMEIVTDFISMVSKITEDGD